MYDDRHDDARDRELRELYERISARAEEAAREAADGVDVYTVNGQTMQRYVDNLVMGYLYPSPGAFMN